MSRLRDSFVASSITFSGRDSFHAQLDRVPRPGAVISVRVGDHSVLCLVETTTTKGEARGKVVRRGLA